MYSGKPVTSIDQVWTPTPVTPKFLQEGDVQWRWKSFHIPFPLSRKQKAHCQYLISGRWKCIWGKFFSSANHFRPISFTLKSSGARSARVSGTLCCVPKKALVLTDRKNLCKSEHQPKVGHISMIGADDSNLCLTALQLSRVQVTPLFESNETVQATQTYKFLLSTNVSFIIFLTHSLLPSIISDEEWSMHRRASRVLCCLLISISFLIVIPTLCITIAVRSPPKREQISEVMESNPNDTMVRWLFACSLLLIYISI